jgi:hypothetical protein
VPSERLRYTQRLGLWIPERRLQCPWCVPTAAPYDVIGDLNCPFSCKYHTAG